MRVAVILAAGLSSRMGDFKPLLPLGPHALIDELIERQRAAGVEAFTVVTGWRGAELAAHLAGTPDVRCVENAAFASSEMFDSIQLGLAAALEGAGPALERVLVTPVDVPLVAPATIERLLACRAACACPEDVGSHRSGHPMALDAPTARRLLACPADETLKTALARLGERPVKVLVDDPAIAMDADTQEDYGELLRYRAAAAGEPLAVRGRVDVTLYVGPCAVDGRVARLLALVEACGSLRQACRAMRISYSTAWRRISQVEDALGCAVVERVSGGAAGGASTLAPCGRALLARWRAVEAGVRTAADGVFAAELAGCAVPGGSGWGGAACREPASRRGARGDRAPR